MTWQLEIRIQAPLGFGSPLERLYPGALERSNSAPPTWKVTAMLTCKHEDIVPTKAHEYLAKSIGNRKLNQDYVLTLAIAMESGKWDDSASEIVFDEDDALIDGHHRLHAIISYGQSVRMLVKRGVSKSARGIIDTGRTRNIRDLMTMFRPEATYVTQRKTALTTCVRLIIPDAPPIRTLDAYDTWYRQFKEGIDVTVELVHQGVSGSGSPLRLGPVMGALAFAHKINPKKVEGFTTKLRDGVGLGRHEPAYTLRNLLYRPALSARRGNGGSDRLVLARKVLNACYADLRGREYRTAQDGRDGVEYFRTAYDGKSISRLVELWTHEMSAPLELVQ